MLIFLIEFTLLGISESCFSSLHSEGNGKESGSLPQPQNSSIGFQLLTERKLMPENKSLKVAPSAESGDEMLVVDETPTRSKAVDTSSATIKPASLKLKLSGIGGISYSGSLPET